jgi:hypothetical protein
MSRELSYLTKGLAEKVSARYLEKYSPVYNVNFSYLGETKKE